VDRLRRRQRLDDRLLVLAHADHVLLEHQLEYEVAAVERGLAVGNRVEPAR